mgnify:CR=1 FL=1
MKRTAVYPFTAIVGQEEMKLSLILNVINPALGGVPGGYSDRINPQ